MHLWELFNIKDVTIYPHLVIDEFKLRRIGYMDNKELMLFYNFPSIKAIENPEVTYSRGPGPAKGPCRKLSDFLFSGCCVLFGLFLHFIFQKYNNL